MSENLLFAEKEIVSLTGLSRMELMSLKAKAIAVPVIKKPIRYTYNQLIFLRLVKLLKKYLSSQFIGEIVAENFVFECDLSNVSLIIVTGIGILQVDDSKEIQEVCDKIFSPLKEEIFEEVVRKESKINTILTNANLYSAERVLIVPVYRVRKNLREKAEQLDIYNYQKREKFGLTNLMPKNIA